MGDAIITCASRVAGDVIPLFSEIESETGTWEFSELCPTTMPTTSPTASPTTMPTSAPSASPSPSPTPDPSPAPSPEPTTPMPTQAPTVCTDTCIIDATFYQGVTVDDCILLITEGNFEEDFSFNETSESFVDILNVCLRNIHGWRILLVCFGVFCSVALFFTTFYLSGLFYCFVCLFVCLFTLFPISCAWFGI